MTETDRVSMNVPGVGDIQALRRPCPACGTDNRDTPAGRYGRDGWQVKDCRSCGFVFLELVPVYEELFDNLAWKRSTARESKRRHAARPVTYRMSRLTRFRLHMFPRKRVDDLLIRYATPGNVLDIGCAEGGRLLNLPAAFVPFGIEIEPNMAAKADAAFSARGGEAVNAPSLEGLRQFPGGHFTGATLRSYLEHEIRPREVLVEIARTLAPGGIAIIKVPNYAALMRHVMGGEWSGFRFPEHVNYFTPDSLTAMIRGCGLDILRFGWTDRLPTSDNMWMIAVRR
ncbi:MAG: class I SAM-dependent methyltransferase [Pseudomonadota bacterium]|nr:class I SAM-dependent methyltransferase [Pseudomonadota bacterium]